MFKGWPIVSGGLIAGTVVAMALTLTGTPPPEPPPTGAANLDFVVQDMNGQTVRLADFRGQPVIMNFWATWCGPCRMEIPELNALADQYRAQKLVVLGISVDDQPEALRKFAQEFPIKYPVLVGLGQDKLQESYDAAMAIPVTWFIRADGTVQAVQKGPATGEWFAEQTKTLVKSSSGDRP